MARRLIVTADDFGLDAAVNEAVEIAAREGVVTAASLMVAETEAADAIRRAKRLPELRVGLHLSLVDSVPASPPEALTALVGGDGRFPRHPLRASLAVLGPAARRQLRAEIRAQFRAFAATGLPLDHADAHRHLHLHPVVGAAMLEIGREFGLPAVRVPHEPPALVGGGAAAIARAVSLAPWTGLLRRRARRAGLAVNDHGLGLAWSGRVTLARLLAALPRLPEGVTELYVHPAVEHTPRLRRLMPHYRPEEELRALCSPALRTALAAHGIELASFASLPARDR